jgi:anti-sigma-K factor RskA
MNAQEFISSGLLEAYVLGAGSDAERREVEAMVASYPEVKAELSAIEEALNAYALKHAIEPPAHLKEKILGKISSAPRVSANGKEEHREFRLEASPYAQQSTNRVNIFAIAATLILLGSLGVNFYLYTQMKTDEGQITVMNDKVQGIAKTLQDSALVYQAMRNEHYVLTDPMFRMVELKGLKVAPESKALACWCPNSKELYFSPEKLPAAPKGMQYQLWAIVDGKPIDVGMVKMDSGVQKMKPIANATAFAVTLEKEGGSETPHGDMYVMGSI